MKFSATVWTTLFAIAVAGAAATSARAANLPAGTGLTVRLDNEVAPGDKHSQQFQATLSNSVFVAGQEVLPMGSRIEGEVRGSEKSVVLSPRYLYLPGGKRLDFNAAVREIDGKQLKADEKEGTIEKQGDGADAARQAAQVGMAGAGVGAMSTGSAKGMGIGAAAGAGAVLIGRKIAGRRSGAVIPAGTQLTLNLTRPLELPDNADSLTQTAPTDSEDRRPVLRRDN